MTRAIYIGDVHGCLPELDKLLAQVRYDPGSDKLAFVGDLVDRGPDSVGVVRLVRRLAADHDVVCVRGNHEHKYIQYHQRLARGDPAAASLFGPKRALYEAFDEADLAWLSGLPHHASVGAYRVVHGGIDRRHVTLEDLDRKKYQDRLFLIRTVDPETHQMSSWGVPWASQYDGRFGPVVYGHEPRDEVRVDAHAVGLDTSCCFGGHLTAMVVTPGDPPRFEAVAAERTYALRRDAFRD